MSLVQFFYTPKIPRLLKWQKDWVLRRDDAVVDRRQNETKTNNNGITFTSKEHNEMFNIIVRNPMPPAVRLRCSTRPMSLFHSFSSLSLVDVFCGWVGRWTAGLVSLWHGWETDSKINEINEQQSCFTSCKLT